MTLSLKHSVSLLVENTNSEEDEQHSVSLLAGNTNSEEDESQSQYPATPQMVVSRSKRKREAEPQKKNVLQSNGMFAWNDCSLNFDNI